MDAKVAIAWLKAFNEKIQEHKDYLSELDTPIGDGDHGANMARGMEFVMSAIEEKNPASAADALKLTAMQLLSHVGGASGPLYGSAFLGMSMKADASTEEMLEAGLQQIQKRGHAEVGEKTMVDLWSPAIEAMCEGNLTPDAIETLVEATGPMRATKGRASYTGDRSIGHIDPGACSSGYLMTSLLEAMQICGKDC